MEYTKEFVEWANSFDEEYLQNRVKFAPEPFRSIVKVIIEVRGESKGKLI